MSRPRRLVLQLLAALAVALLLLLAVVWPAEFHRDPTGFGGFSGLLGLSAPKASAPNDQRPWNSDTVDIALAFGQEAEFTVGMRQGQTLVYAWQVLGPNTAGPADPDTLQIEPGEPGPDRVYFDFHGQGHAAEPGLAAPSQSYLKQDATRRSQGALVAPFDGLHGWYFLNDSQGPIVIRLRLAGFYQITPH